MGLGRRFDVLADYTEANYRRLMRLVAWLVEHPQAGYFVQRVRLCHRRSDADMPRHVTSTTGSRTESP
jgi:hypothetical protein